MTEPPADPPPTPPAPPAPDDEKKFTQADVTRLAAQEKAQGERKARRKLLEDLGLDPDTAKTEDIKAVLDAKKAAEEATLSAAEKAKRDAESDRAAAAKDKADAATILLDARKQLALVGAGVGTAVLADAATLLKVAPDVTDEDLTVEIGKLKERLPALFTGSVAPPPPPGGRPGGTPPRQQPNGDAYQRGAERAKKLAEAAS